MARLVVTAVVGEGRSKSEVARDYGVSRRWVQILVQRFLAEGEADDSCALAADTIDSLDLLCSGFRPDRVTERS